MKSAFILTTALILVFNKVSSQNYKDGDIVFIKNKDIKGKSLLPNGKSSFNYVGIIFIEDKIPVVYHSTQPLSKTTLVEFINLSEDKSFKIKFLSEEELLTNAVIESMHSYAVSKLGSSYDNELKLNNENLYNAEFVWKIYQDAIGLALCIPREIKDYRMDSTPAMEFLTESYGEAILNEKIVAIGDIFQSQFLD